MATPAASIDRRGSAPPRGMAGTLASAMAAAMAEELGGAAVGGDCAAVGPASESRGVFCLEGETGQAIVELHCRDTVPILQHL